MRRGAVLRLYCRACLCLIVLVYAAWGQLSPAITNDSPHALYTRNVSIQNLRYYEGDKRQGSSEGAKQVTLHYSSAMDKPVQPLADERMQSESVPAHYQAQPHAQHQVFHQALSMRKSGRWRWPAAMNVTTALLTKRRSNVGSFCRCVAAANSGRQGAAAR